MKLDNSIDEGNSDYDFFDSAALAKAKNNDDTAQRPSSISLPPLPTVSKVKEAVKIDFMKKEYLAKYVGVNERGNRLGISQKEIIKLGGFFGKTRNLKEPVSKTEVIPEPVKTQTSAPKKGLFAMLMQAKAEKKTAATPTATVAPPEPEETLGLLNFKPAEKAIVEPVAARIIEQANTKFPLESQHALTLLHSTIPDQLARVDLLSYSMIYFYSVNSDSSSMNIPLR